MKSLLMMAGVLAAMLAPSFTLAGDGLPDAFDDDPQPKFMLVEAEAFTGVSSRLDLLEAKVQELDETKVTAAEARAIANEEIEKVLVALRSADGEVKQQAVSVGTDEQGAFQLEPGEQLLGYTDPFTGKYVDLTREKPRVSYAASGQPVTAHQSGSVQVTQYRSAARDQPTRATVQVRGGPLRRLFGRSRATSSSCYVDASGNQ